MKHRFCCLLLSSKKKKKNKLTQVYFEAVEKCALECTKTDTYVGRSKSFQFLNSK